MCCRTFFFCVVLKIWNWVSRHLWTWTVNLWAFQVCEDLPASFLHLTAATGWAFFSFSESHWQSLDLGTAYVCVSPSRDRLSLTQALRTAQMCPDQKEILACSLSPTDGEWAAETCLCCLSTGRRRTCISSTSPILSHYQPSSAGCPQGIGQAERVLSAPHKCVATTPELMSVRHHTLQGERHSPEGTWGIVITAPLWRGHGCLAWCHHLPWRQLLPGCTCSPKHRLFCFT